MNSARYIKIDYFLTCGTESHTNKHNILFEKKKLKII